jgi:hypothetical protein
MSIFRARPTRAGRMAAILGMGLVAAGLSVAAAPAAGAAVITICNAGVCTTTPFEPILCHYVPLPDGTFQLQCT